MAGERLAESTHQTDHVAGVAYGLRISGFRDAALAGIGPEDLPLVEVRQAIGDATPRPRRIGPDSAQVGGSLVIDRIERTATVHTEVPLPTDQLVHPILAWVGAVFAHWRGFLGMHGGAAVVDGGAWMVVAEKGGGKSSTLAALHLAGFQVMTDDLIIVADGDVMPGPRCIDVKEDPGRLLGAPVRHTRHGDRRRILLPDIAGPVPLAGAILLAWGERVQVEPVPVRSRLASLVPHRTLQETDPAVMLQLASVPTWTVTRPRSLESLPVVVDHIRDVAAG